MPESIHTVAKVHLGATAAGPTLTRIELETEGSVHGLDDEKFRAFAETAKKTCLVSRALAGVPDIRLTATLLAQPMPDHMEEIMDAEQSRTTADIMQRFNDVFQRHDPSGLAALVAEDCVIENTVPAPDGARYVGRDACVALWSGIATSPGTRFDLEETFVAGDRATIRWRYGGATGKLRARRQSDARARRPDRRGDGLREGIAGGKLAGRRSARPPCLQWPPRDQRWSRKGGSSSGSTKLPA